MKQPTIMGVALSQRKVGNLWHTASMQTGREFIPLVCNVKIHTQTTNHTHTHTHKEEAKMCIRIFNSD